MGSAGTGKRREVGSDLAGRPLIMVTVAVGDQYILSLCKSKSQRKAVTHMEVLVWYLLVVGQRGPLTVLNAGNRQRALNCGGYGGEQNGGWLAQKGVGEGGRRA